MLCVLFRFRCGLCMIVSHFEALRVCVQGNQVFDMLGFNL